MTDQLAIDIDRLFAKIGRLVIENEVLHEQLAQEPDKSEPIQEPDRREHK